MATRRKTRNKWIKKIELILFALLAIACVLIGIIGMFSIARINEQAVENFKSQTGKISETLFSYLRSAISHGSTLFREPNIILYFKPEKIISIEQKSHSYLIQYEVNRSENLSYPFTLNEYIFYTDDENIMTSDGTYSKELFFSSINRYENLPDDIFREAGNSDEIQILPATEVKVHGSGIFVLPIVTRTRRNGSTAVHIANLDAERIRDILFSSNSTYDWIISDTETGVTLLSSTDDVVLNPQDKTYISIQDSISGITIEAADSENGFSGLNKIIYLSVFLMLIIILFGSHTVIVLARMIFRPFENIQSILSHPSNEIEAIEESIASLVEDKNELEAKNIRHKILMAINKMPVDKDNLEADLRKSCAFSFTHYALCCFLFKDDDIDHTSTIENVIKKAFEEKTVNFLLINMDSLMVEVLLNADDFSDSETIVDKMCTLLENDNSDAFFGMSTETEDLSRLSSLHKEAVAAIPPRIATTSKHGRCYSSIPKNETISFSFYDQKGIRNNILSGNKEELHQFLSDLIEKNDSKNLNMNSMCEVLQQILLTAKNVLDIEGHSTEEIHTFSLLYNSLSRQQDRSMLSKLEKETISILEEIQSLCTVQDTENQSLKIKEIINYINQNYLRELYLDLMAEELEMSPKYLSALFKKETGKNITDYVTELKISKAKEMIVENNLKIGEIASAVGIDSRATFVRLFKKFEGITPSEYKKIYLIKEIQKNESY